MDDVVEPVINTIGRGQNFRTTCYPGFVISESWARRIPVTTVRTVVPARRHDLHGAGPRRRVHLDLPGRAQRAGDGFDSSLRLGGAEATVAPPRSRLELVGAFGLTEATPDPTLRAACARLPAAMATTGSLTVRRGGSATRVSPTSRSFRPATWTTTRCWGSSWNAARRDSRPRIYATRSLPGTRPR
jgi:hypothetical protein